jgi:amino acid transporter
MRQSSETDLVRGIRRWDLVALVVNSVIGAGIFGLPATVYAKTGPYSLLAFMACAVLVILLVLCFAEVTSRFTRTGGPYLYAREVFSPWIAFQVGWLLWLTRLTAFAAVCNLLIQYLGYFWPAAEAGAGRAAIITLIVTVLTAINIAGVRTSALVGDVFTVGKLLPLVLFVAVGLFFIEPRHYSTEALPGYGDFTTAVLLLVYAFTGFEIPVIAAGEVSDPRRDFPFALLAGIGVVVLLYVLIQFVCIGTLPELAESKRPLADAASRFLGAAGATIISLGALVSTTGTLNAIMLAGSRLPFALAEQGQLPQWLARTHPRFHTPYVSILISAVLILALTLSGTFIYALTLSTIARLFTYASTCLALIVLRRREDRPAAFTLPGGIFVALASLALIVWLLSNVKPQEALPVALAVAAGLVLCALGRRSAASGPSNKA